MTSQSGNDKPLRLVCRCGYRKSLPAKFAGRKVVCPKCTTVLRIERIKKIAELLVRCPWCRDLSKLNLENKVCDSCEREFEFNVSVGPLGKEGAAKATPSVAVALPARNDEDDGIRIEASGPAVATDLSAYRRKRRSIVGLLISNLIGFCIIGALGYLLWDKYGEELGLKEPQVIAVETVPSREQTVPTDTPLAVKEEQLTTKEKPSPKLTSPAIELLGVEHDVAQALDPVSSEVVGSKLFLEINFRNLSLCDITKFEARVQLIDGTSTKRATKEVFEFERPVSPQESRTAVATLPVQSFTGVKVTVTEVWASDQSDATEIVKEIQFE